MGNLFACHEFDIQNTFTVLMLVFCRFNMRRKQDQEHLSNEIVPSDLLNIQGIAFAKKGQFEEAIGCFVKAHELNPNNPLSLV